MQKTQEVLQTDPKAAKDFLSHFNYELVTLVSFRNGKVAETVALPYGGLSLANRHDCELFFMVNEGDGVIHEGKKTCRSQKSVTKLKACFIDVDNCPLSKLSTYLKEVILKPHLIVETSPNKYHLYFLLKPTQATYKTTKLWRATQLALAYFSDPAKPDTGCDPSMSDHSRILRIPGFYHQKQTPHLVTLKHTSQHPPYSLSEIADKTNAKLFLPQETPTGSTIYSIPQHVPAGSRHNDMTSFLAHLLNRDVPPETVKELFYSHAKVHYENFAEFLPNGPRHQEVEKFIQYKQEQADRARKNETVKLLNKTDGTDPFQLPDDFYFSCPGPIGALTQEISEKAYISNASFTFASLIAAIGTLKAPHTETSLGHAPANYFLCIGPTGSGKNYIQEVLLSTFGKLGINGLIEGGIRSDKGIIRFLERNQGTGLLLADEAEYFLSSLNDSSTPSYLRSCKKLLLDLYTSTRKVGWTPGSVGNPRERLIVLNRPRLNLVGFGAVTSLGSSFSLESIQQGFLQRFIVVTDYRDIATRFTSDFNPATSINSAHLDYLKEIVKEQMLLTEQELLEYQDLTLELNGEGEPGAKQKALLEKLTELKISSSHKKVIPFTEEAEARFFSYRLELAKKHDKHRRTPLCGLFTRGAEQVGRLAAVIAEEKVTVELVEYLIQFIDSRINALVNYAQENLGDNQLGQDLQDLINFVAERTAKTGGKPVLYSIIARYFRIRNPRALKELLKMAVETSMIIEHSDIRKSDKAGRRGTAYSLGDVEHL